jgi:methionyl-tRNA formyltransferase
MRMDEGLDTGPLIATRRWPLEGDETAPALEAGLATMAARLLVDVLPDWLGGRLPALPQPHTGATLTRPLRREDGRLDPTRGAEALERQVRAYQPWPGSFIDPGTTRLVVWRASVVPDDDPGEPIGALVPFEDSVALVTADGRLRLDEVQRAGGARMSGAAYRRGLR